MANITSVIDDEQLRQMKVNRATPTPNRVAILDALSESNDTISRLVAAVNSDTSAMAFSRILGKPNEKISSRLPTMRPRLMTCDLWHLIFLRNVMTSRLSWLSPATL